MNARLVGKLEFATAECWGLMCGMVFCQFSICSLKFASAEGTFFSYGMVQILNFFNW